MKARMELDAAQGLTSGKERESADEARDFLESYPVSILSYKSPK